MDDDLLREFVNECRDHLATIEADLLEIEEQGADADRELVNKVFRAAHSIKGGSGFFGFDKMKDLAHRAETVLDMLRAGKIVPNAEVTNILLAAFDKLRELVNAPDRSHEADIDDLLEGLVGLASSYLPPDEKATLQQFVELSSAAGDITVRLPRSDLEMARRQNQYVYVVACDLIHDVERNGINALDLFKDLDSIGEIVDCAIDYEAVGTLDSAVGSSVPLRVVLATTLEHDLLDTVFETFGSDRFHLVFDPGVDAIPASAPADDATPEAIDDSADPAFAAADTAPSGMSDAAPEEPAAAPTARRSASVPPVAPAPAAEYVPSPAPAPRGAPSATVARPGPRPAAAATGPESATATPPGSGAGAHGGSSDETLRVKVELLDSLMNLAGELVLSRNQLRAAVEQDNREALLSVNQRMSHITAELQDVIMQTRLQPVGNVFSKIPRVVRDLSQTLGKDVELEILGKDVALDKAMVEGLSDPLTHMVRNAVDHGIEARDERLRAGKEAAGVIRVEARHEAGQVVVEIADDGKGIDPRKVADTAVRKGLITADKARAMSAREQQELIFLPGLSTTAVVSEISGRGVGMDVVKTNLDRLGGQVEIDSEPGKGTTFRIKLPLTLAIIPSLIVSIERERFAIPQASIEELLRLRPAEVKDRIELVGDCPVLRLRDRVLPVARLDQILGIVAAFADPVTQRREINRRTRLADRRSRRHPALTDGQDLATALRLQDFDAEPAAQGERDDGFSERSAERREAPSSALEIVVVRTGALSYGLVVGGFHDTEEVVVKPLSRRLKERREYSGATILGDGTVALILDVAGLAASSGLTSVSATVRAAELAAQAEQERLRDLQQLLTFCNLAGEACAVPLDTVHRIVRIRPYQVERLGDSLTMQFREQSLPLVVLPYGSGGDTVAENLVVLVSSVYGREFGLLGTGPIDVIETRAVVDQRTHRQGGIAGSTILDGRTTLIADLADLIDLVHPDWREAAADVTAASTPRQGLTVLLAEDSDFFRAQVCKYLEQDGMKVLAAPDGEAAWELLVQNLDHVDIVVTDIEMPRLTGLGLAARIRGDERTAGLPIIAVTSLAGDEDAERGHAVGITEYQVKLDRDRLLASVRALAAPSGAPRHPELTA